MRTLYYSPFCPFSRKVRLVLAEKKLDFTLEMENFWEKSAELLKLNPLGQLPLLIDLNGVSVADSAAIVEYLDELYPEKKIVGDDVADRAEARRISGWFDSKFHQEVSSTILYEKSFKRFMLKNRENSPDSALIRNAKNAIHYHLDYLSWLVDRRNWLAGDNFSLADVTAAAHLSTIDYLGDVPWDKHDSAKQWYMRIKSRPSFRPFFSDRLPGILPVSYYQELDF